MTKVVPDHSHTRRPSRLTFAEDNGGGTADATKGARAGSMEWSYSAGPTASGFARPEEGNLGKAQGLQRVSTMAAVKSASKALKTISKGATSRGVRHLRSRGMCVKRDCMWTLKRASCLVPPAVSTPESHASMRTP